MSLLRPIHHTFAPHINISYVFKTLVILFIPWKWKRGDSQIKFEKELSNKFNADCFLFSSGRESLCALLRSLKLQNGEEIIVQGYTCIAVPNAIHAAGGVPIYADIDRNTLNMIPKDVEEKITNRTRAIICQHTFGIPSDTKTLRKICDKHNIVLIEDCAHIIPDESGPLSICTYGDFIFFSFGRDKAISGITGGAVLSRKKNISLLLRAERSRSVQISYFMIFRLLSYPFIYLIARPLYGLFIGKAFLFLLKKIRWMVPILTNKEKIGNQSPIPHYMPNACAFLALSQFKKLKKINDHRRKLTKLYITQYSNIRIFPSDITSDLPLQKFPLFIINADEIRLKLKKKNIHLNDGWTGCVICPPDIYLDPTNYIPGSDPMAEAVCEKILSLPIHPTMTEKHVKKLIKILACYI